jgi:prevent-host-death family protein
MVRKISALAVRGRLSEILEEVYRHGDSVIIERAGRAMAVLVSPAEYERLRARRAQRFRVYDRIKARTKRIAPAKLDRAIEEGVRAARARR